MRFPVPRKRKIPFKFAVCRDVWQETADWKAVDTSFRYASRPSLFSPPPADSGPNVAALAQLVEHRIRNAGVTGSSPVSGTISPKIVIKQSSEQRSSHDCRTRVSHTSLPTCDLTSSKTSASRSPNCRASVSHRRHVGLWRRGAIYQYRVRVPADLRPLIRVNGGQADCRMIGNPDDHRDTSTEEVEVWTRLGHAGGWLFMPPFQWWWICPDTTRQVTHRD